MVQPAKLQDGLYTDFAVHLACIASVSVGLSTGLKHFSLLGVSAKTYEKGEGISVALAPTFTPPKSEKRVERAENPTETLAM